MRRREEMNNQMRSSQENEEEKEGEEVVEEGMKEEQRPCYSWFASPQIQAQTPVPMGASPRPGHWRAGTGLEVFHGGPG